MKSGLISIVLMVILTSCFSINYKSNFKVKKSETRKGESYYVDVTTKYSKVNLFGGIKEAEVSMKTTLHGFGKSIEFMLDNDNFKNYLDLQEIDKLELDSVVCDNGIVNRSLKLDYYIHIGPEQVIVPIALEKQNDIWTVLKDI